MLTYQFVNSRGKSNEAINISTMKFENDIPEKVNYQLTLLREHNVLDTLTINLWV